MNKFFNIIVALIYIIFGIVIWNNPFETLKTYALIIGGLHLLSSISVLFYTFFYKIRPLPIANILISLIMGIIIFSLPFLSLYLIVWVFIFAFLFIALYFVYYSYYNINGINIIQLIISLFAVSYGFIMLFSPSLAANTLGKIISILVIFNGFSYLIPRKSK